MDENNAPVLSDRELLESISYRLGKIERREKVRVAKNWIIAALIIGLFVAAALIIVPKVKTAVAYYERIASKANEVAATVESIDFEKVRGMVDALGEIDSEKISGIVEQVGEIDFAAIGQKLNALSSIDLEPLLQQISKIITSLQTFSLFN